MGDLTMGTVYTDITLQNTFDTLSLLHGKIKETEVRKMTAKALVDTGAGTLIINEAARRQLGLTIQGNRSVLLADGSRQNFQQTEPVDIFWKNRHSTCRAIVLPDAKEILLGAIPMEDMDLIINPMLQEVTGAHGDEVLCLAV
jgi:clan AA aspartic protease